MTTSELVVINVPTYDNVFDILEQDADPHLWRGKTVVNLVTGTPEESCMTHQPG